MSERTNPYVPSGRETVKLGKDRIVRNKGRLNRRILIGVPTLGLIRIEWDVHRRGQTIPINWQVGEITANHMPASVFSEGYHTADAQNVIIERVVLDNYEWCFRGDTLVETIDGAKPIRDVQVGETVKTHTGQFSRVLKTMRRELPQRTRLTWVRTANSTIKCTPEHPFWTFRSVAPEWVSAKDLRPGDALLYPHTPKEDLLFFDVKYQSSGRDGRKGSRKYGAEVGSVSVDQRLARFLGLFLAEGHASPRSGYLAFTFSNDETQYAAFVAEMSESLFGRAAVKHRTWATQVRIGIRAVAQLFQEWFGHRAKNKRVPEFVFGWDLRNRLAFLKGYLDGDGAYQGGGCVFSSASHGLVEDIVRLGKSCGLMFAKVSEIRTKDPLVPRAIGDHGGMMRGQILFSSRLGSQSLTKMLDLNDALSLLDGYLATPIRAVDKRGMARPQPDPAVYNLEVEGDNSYIAGCAAVHNCLLYEDDVLPPFDALFKMNLHMERMTAPLVSGLYYSKGEPTWPLTFRGRGNGAYRDWAMGDQVWCDGVPTGFLLIHGDVLRWFWANSEEYKLPDGRRCRRVFEFQRKSWYDPEQDRYFAQMGTSDLYFCDRIRKEKVFEKVYPKGHPFRKFGRMRYPFLCDTEIFAQQVDHSGKYYPAGCKEVLPPTRKPKQKAG